MILSSTYQLLPAEESCEGALETSSVSKHQALISWNDVDWKRFQQAVIASGLLQDVSIVNSSPMIQKQVPILNQFGFPSTIDGNSIRVSYSKIDWQKFILKAANARVPFSPSIVIQLGPRNTQWIRIGIDPLPNHDFSIPRIGQTHFETWTQMLRSRTLPLSLDLIWHEIMHVLTYAEDPEYAELIYQFYKVSSSRKPDMGLWRTEEAGVYQIISGPRDFISFVEENRALAKKDVHRFLEKLSTHLRAYGAISRQIAVHPIQGYQCEQFPWSFAIALLRGAVIIEPDFQLEMYELYNILHFLSDLQSSPGIAFSYNHQNEVHAKAMADLKELMKTDRASVENLIQELTDKILDEMIKMANHESYQVSGLYRYLRMRVASAP